MSGVVLRTRGRVNRLVLCAAVVLCGVGITAAQTYPGILHGEVRDAQGAVPGAEVVLIDEDTNATRSAMSDGVGEYAFTSVRPGTYTISISLPGFKAEQRKGLRISREQPQAQDFTLEVTAILEQISIDADVARQSD
jgi:hypothetical protein